MQNSMDRGGGFDGRRKKNMEGKKEKMTCVFKHTRIHICIMYNGAGGPPATELTLTLSSVAAPLSLLHLQVHILSYLFLSRTQFLMSRSCMYMWLQM